MGLFLGKKKKKRKIKQNSSMPIIFKLLLKISKYPPFQTYCMVSRIKRQIANSIIYSATYQHYSLVYRIYCINKNGKLQGIKIKYFPLKNTFLLKKHKLRSWRNYSIHPRWAEFLVSEKYNANTGPFLPASMASTSRTSIIILYHRKKIHIPL